MKDERKKLKLIILQCIAVITVNFITIWYFEELFFRLKCIFNFQLARVNSSLIEITSAHIYCH